MAAFDGVNICFHICEVLYVYTVESVHNNLVFPRSILQHNSTITSITTVYVLNVSEAELHSEYKGTKYITNFVA